jgi:tellurite resistance protein TerC
MGSPGLWVAFNLCVLAMLAVDLFVFNRGAHEISLRTAAIWSAVWVLLSLGFAAWILRAHGRTPALEFLTGYLIEKSLSIDNLFVFLVVFRGLGIERKFQHRVLFWGVLGALLLRGALIALGAALLQRFSWVLYLFGAFLVLVGLQLLLRGNRGFNPKANPLLAWARRVFPVSGTAQEARFFIFENGRRAVTHLFLALLVIEFADVLFALDSVPAVFGITRDPFLVYSSNVCAILGLRAFYFLLAGALPLFRFLDVGVSSVLIFIGAKMLAEPWIHVPTLVSLLVVAALLGIAVTASLAFPRTPKMTDA